jgi:hypothetical protein
LLGLELPDAFALLWVAGAVMLSWTAAESYSRFVVAPASSRSIGALHVSR